MILQLHSNLKHEMWDMRKDLKIYGFNTNSVSHLIVSGLMAIMARRSLPPGQSRSGRPTWTISTEKFYLIIFFSPQIFKVSKNIETWISAAANRPPISQAESWLIPSLGTICQQISAVFWPLSTCAFQSLLTIFSVSFQAPGRWGGEAELEAGGGEGVLLPLKAPLQIIQQDHQAVWALVSS